MNARISNQAEIDAAVAEEAQRAFLDAASTAQLLFCAKSVVHDLNQRNYISGRAFEEELLAECRLLTKGDELKARLLASAAIA